MKNQKTKFIMILILCLISSKFALAGGIGNESRFTLQGARKLIKNQKITYSPPNPLPVHEISRLCFTIGEMKESNTEYVETLIEEQFGKEEYDNVWMHRPDFIVGYVKDSHGKKFNLKGDRLMKTHTTTFDGSERSWLDICTPLNEDPKEITEITFYTFKDFSAQKIFWSTFQKAKNLPE